MPATWIPHSVLSKMPKAWETSAVRPSATARSQRMSACKYGGRGTSNQ